MDKYVSWWSTKTRNVNSSRPFKINSVPPHKNMLAFTLLLVIYHTAHTIVRTLYTTCHTASKYAILLHQHSTLNKSLTRISNVYYWILLNILHFCSSYIIKIKIIYSTITINMDWIFRQHMRGWTMVVVVSTVIQLKCSKIFLIRNYI